MLNGNANFATNGENRAKDDGGGSDQLFSDDSDDDNNLEALSVVASNSSDNAKNRSNPKVPRPRMSKGSSGGDIKSLTQKSGDHASASSSETPQPNVPLHLNVEETRSTSSSRQSKLPPSSHTTGRSVSPVSPPPRLGANPKPALQRKGSQNTTTNQKHAKKAEISPKKEHSNGAALRTELCRVIEANSRQSPVVQQDLCVPVSLPNDVVHIDEVEWAPEDATNASSTGGNVRRSPPPRGAPAWSRHGVGLDAKWEPPREMLATRPRYEKIDPCGCVPSRRGAPCCVDTTCVLFACQEECPSSCETGRLCGNRRITRKKWKELQVFDAGLKGRGLRVLQDVVKGDFITEYVGIAVKRKFLDDLFRRYRNERMLYIMSLDNDVYIDARKRGGIARYINHSCEPNCVVHRWKVRGISRAGIFALRDIRAGEELSFDYKWDRKRGRAPTKCHCNSPLCRGTLELLTQLTPEEEELEMKLMGHWKVPKNKNVGREIINRCVKIYFEGNHEYYAADVCKYDESTGKHLVVYKQELEESWEDLSKEQWLILDEEAEKFVIAKKGNRPFSSSLFNQPGSPGSSVSVQRRPKNYVIVQTPVKEALVARHIIDKCQRHCRVQINILRCVGNPSHFSSPTSLEDQDDEAAEEWRALQESKDGNVWKFSIVGLNPIKARTFLEKNVEDIKVPTQSGALGNLGGSGRTVLPAQARSPDYAMSQEVIIPRCIVSSVKSRMPSMRTQCRNVDIAFVHSNSKSKEFAKLLIRGSIKHDLLRTQTLLWKELQQFCKAANAPLTLTGKIKDLCFLGGEISKEEFMLLFRNHASQLHGLSCNENLQHSVFVKSFEDMHQCSIWIQTEDDMGRIDSKNRVINQADPSGRRKVFLGCDPKHVSDLWDLIKKRAVELSRGVLFMNLGTDVAYLPVLQTKRDRIGQPVSSFFEFVESSSGASVTVDDQTRNHLRIEAVDDVNKDNKGDNKIDMNKTANCTKLAEELIRLQLEIFRDHFARQQRWLFGRDWSLVGRKSSPTSSGNFEGLAFGPSSTPNHHYDARAIANACIDIVEITSSLGLHEEVASHACVILYRFLEQVPGAFKPAKTPKLREIVLACLFIANKAQKIVKWKRLEMLLSAAYETFYAGATFNERSEEAENWEKRVLAAEVEVLSKLDYDVFWSGVDWIILAAVGGANVSEPMAQNAIHLALSGPVLAAGCELWIKLGPEYVFAIMVCYLSKGFGSIVSALQLNASKLPKALELISKSVEAQPFGKRASLKKSSRTLRILLGDGEKSFLKCVPQIRALCHNEESRLRKAHRSGQLSEIRKRHHSIARCSQRRRIFEGVGELFLEKNIAPILGAVCAESNCTAFVEQTSDQATANIIIEGNWRGLAIAESFLVSVFDKAPSHEAKDVEVCRSSLNRGGKKPGNRLASEKLPEFRSPRVMPTNQINPQILPPTLAMISNLDEYKKVVSKDRSGIILTTDIDIDSGWEGASEYGQLIVPRSGLRDVGGKTCMAGKVANTALRRSGLRWLIPSRFISSPSGFLHDFLSVRKGFRDCKTSHLRELARISDFIDGDKRNEERAFSLLSSHQLSDTNDTSDEAPYVPISLQKWPSEKVDIRERKSSGKVSSMDMGFSAAALQEMQLLEQLHHQIPSPRGHPNFTLPVALALSSTFRGKNERSIESPEYLHSDQERNAFSSVQLSGENSKEVKREEQNAGSYLVLEPTPLTLQKVVTWSKKRKAQLHAKSDDVVVSPVILSCWFHDLLLAVAHCHSNGIIFRTFYPDQILLDHSGVAKISGLSRAVVLSPDDRKRFLDPVKSARSKKSSNLDDEIMNNPHLAPELLLGSTRYTKETDMWSVGCLFASLMLNKPLFSGRDRASRISAIFKILGTPGSDNYSDAEKFPLFDRLKPRAEKRYRRGVEKALRHMLREGSFDVEQYNGAIDLIDKMLHLDPKQRITADEALGHEFMVAHIQQINSDEFRSNFVKDWNLMKSKVMAKDPALNPTQIISNRAEADLAEQDKKRHRRRDSKRKAFLIEKVMDDNGGEPSKLNDTAAAPNSKHRKIFPQGSNGGENFG